MFNKNILMSEKMWIIQLEILINQQLVLMKTEISVNGGGHYLPPTKLIGFALTNQRLYGSARRNY